MSNLFRLRRDPLRFLMEVARDYGDIAYFKVGPQDVFLINNPDYIRDVLVTHSSNFVKSRGLELARRFFLGDGLLTAEGDLHRRQRRLLQPAFHRQRISAYGDVMTEYAARMQQRWEEGSTVDIWQEMMRATLAIAGKTLLDADLESEALEIGEALTDLIHVFNRVTLPFAGLLEKLPLPSNRRFQKARNRLDATVYRIINERRASGRDRGDLLSMLLCARDEESGGSMTDVQVRDEAMTLFIAGHETTANALTWTWYLLSQNPEAEAKLHSEVDRVLAGRRPTTDDLPGLKYAEMVFAEAMRLYPPAWTIGRRALNDYRIGDYVVPGRSIILMCQYVTHHDPRYFPDPFRFDPERWIPEVQAARHKFSYFPFGGGPRVCIGESFAWMEGVLLISTVAQRWRMRLAPGHEVALEPLITLRPRYGMRMMLERR